MMDQQMDEIVIREFLVPQTSAFLKQLSERMLDENERRESWFDIFLSVFIILNNTEMKIAAEREFAQRYGFSVGYTPT